MTRNRRTPRALAFCAGIILFLLGGCDPKTPHSEDDASLAVADATTPDDDGPEPPEPLDDGGRADAALSDAEVADGARVDAEAGPPPPDADDPPPLDGSADGTSPPDAEPDAECQEPNCAPPVCPSGSQDDGNPCTDDDCELGEVVHTPSAAGTDCSAANPCDGQAVCDGAGQCLPGATLSFDDGDDCTTDSCTPSQGVAHAPIANCRPTPRNPVGLAPALRPAVASNLYEATRFLYEGDNPVQVAVAAAAIDRAYFAWIRGRVLDRNGVPMRRVLVQVSDHPEFGTTLTRADGAYDLVVSSSPVVLDFSGAGLLPAHRHLAPKWQEATTLPDVVLIPVDPKSTQVELTAGAPAQFAQASLVQDRWGARQETLFFEEGTTATIVLADGTRSSLEGLTVRSTEYTVGDSGPLAMPAELPASSAYTHAFEVTVDEAVAAGASRVEFSQPVIGYVDNFLGFPTGTPVPLGYYDRERKVWAASDNGVVLKVVAHEGDQAVITIGSDDVPAPQTALTALGIGTSELRLLASRYAVGKSLWRMPLPHFSTWDSNVGWGPPIGASPPDSDDPAPNCDGDCDGPMGPLRGMGPGGAGAGGGGNAVSSINQTVQQSVPLSGTPFSLNYRSSRVPGHVGSRSIDMRLTNANPPSILREIVVETQVGGRKKTNYFAPAANLAYSFQWDRRDAFDRVLEGQHNAVVRVGYTYEGSYAIAPRFGYNGNGTRITGGQTSVPWAGRMPPITLWKDHYLNRAGVGRLNARDQLAQGFGGWSINVHHNYDPVGRILYLGSGGRIDDTGVPAGVRERVVQGSCNGCCPTCALRDNAPAESLIMSSEGAGSVLALPDGSVVLAFARMIFHLRRDRTLYRLAGGGTLSPGDNASARDVRLGACSGLSRAADGTIVFFDSGDYRIKAITPSGQLRILAGTGVSDFSGDGGPAAQAGIGPGDTAVAPDGSIYISDYVSNRVRRITPEGRIETVAGTGTALDSGDGGPAVDASLDLPGALAAGPDGSIYVSTNQRNYGRGRVRRITPSGSIMPVAGGCDNANCRMNAGSIAIGTTVAGLHTMRVGPDGLLYMAGLGELKASVWRINGQGVLETVAGGMGMNLSWCPGGIPAMSSNSCFAQPESISLANDGTLYVFDGNYWDGNRAAYSSGLSAIKPALPGFTGQSIAIPSPAGDELYVFDASGKHLETRDALTRGLRYSFLYDAEGRVTSIADRDSRVTTLRRDAAGNLQAIEGPDGQRTELSVDAIGYLREVKHPDGATIQLRHDANGLLSEVRDSRGGVYAFEYDELGRARRASDPASALHQLDRTVLKDGAGRATGHQVERKPLQGMPTRHQFTQLADGSSRYTDANEQGLQSSTEHYVAGGSYTRLPDQSAYGMERGADGISGAMNVPQRWSVSLPSRRSRRVELLRSANRASDGSLLSASWEERVNDRSHQSSFDAASSTWTHRSPRGRLSYETINAQGRLSISRVEGLEPTRFAYDSAGRLTGIRQGTGADERITTLAYGPDGYLDEVTDALGDATRFDHDPNGRPLAERVYGAGAQTSQGEVLFSYDRNGNASSVTPPGKPTHAFTYTAVDQLASYAPPAVAGVATPSTSYKYDLQRNLTAIRRPDGSAIELARDGSGRVTSVQLPAINGVAAEVVSHMYSATTGQLTALAHSGGISLAMTYDGFLVTQEETRGLRTAPVNLSRGFDDDFRLTTELIDGVHRAEFAYDADGLLTAAGALTLTRSVQNGLLTGSNVGVVSDAWEYNAFGEPRGYAASVSGTPLFQTTFTRDKLGRIKQKVETIDGVTTTYEYDYDAAGRLVEVARNGALSSAYSYDPNGNRIDALTPAHPASISATYDAQDRLLSYGGATFTYTANGELRTKTETGAVTTYSYDALGNLRFVQLPDGHQIEYLVDGRGRRVGKKVDGTLVQAFVWGSQLAPAAELDGSGNIVARFVYATKVNVPDYVVKGSTTYRIITDHLGSPRLVIDTTSGAVVQRMDYDEWGVVLRDSNPGFTPFGFAGGLWDVETRLVRFGARDYHSVTGRWMAKDPVGARVTSGALYPYGHGDAVNLIDTDGRMPMPNPNGMSFSSLDRLTYELQWRRYRGKRKFPRNEWPKAGVASVCRLIGWEVPRAFIDRYNPSGAFKDGVDILLDETLTGPALDKVNDAIVGPQMDPDLAQQYRQEPLEQLYDREPD